jgi:hypothetical protein
MFVEVTPFPFSAIPALVLPIISSNAMVQITSLAIQAVKLISWDCINLISTINLNDELDIWSIY